MNVFINGVKRSYKSNLTLEKLLIKLGHAKNKVAVEVNEEIIPRSQLGNKLVVDGDKIEIIIAVGGG